MNDNQCCGTCKWNAYDEGDDWICCKDKNEWCGDWTDYNQTCEFWEDRL